MTISPETEVDLGADRSIAAVWTAAAIGVWAVLVAVGYLWGRSINAHSRAMLLDAPPLFGRWQVHLGVGVLPALVVGALWMAVGRRWAEELRWRHLLLAVPAAAAAWAVALAWIDGPHSLITSLRSGDEYLVALRDVHGLRDYLQGYVDGLRTAPIQIQAHPPLTMVVLWLLRAVGLGGPWPAAAVMIGAGVSSAAAALVALREVAGERVARAAAPFLVVLPAAIWVATSADALFAGVGAWAIALLLLATGRAGRRSDLLAFGGGMLAAATLFLTYGAVLLAFVPLAVLLQRRRWRPLLAAATGGALVTTAFAAAGFWWWSGLQGTLHQYQISVIRDRPADYLLVANLAAFSLALGPGVLVGVARLRDRRAWLLVGGGLAAALVADLSGLSKGEVERIWLMFVPWVALATCSLALGPRATPKLWLGLQAAAGVVLQVLLRTPW